MPSHEPEVVPSSHSVAAKETPLIDRAKEMGLLKETADTAVRGEGGVVILYGEAGIGKTRLTRELRAYARSRGMQVLHGRCPALFRMGSVPPYVLWKEVIRDYMQVCTPEQLQSAVGYYPGEIYKIVPEIKQKLAAFSESPPLSPDLERIGFLRRFRSLSKTFPRPRHWWLFWMICSGAIRLRFCCCIIWPAASTETRCYFWEHTAT